MLEKVDGQYQGAVINFIDHLQSGAIRVAFAPDGSMWVGQTSRGWGSAGGAPFGVQRIVYDGKTMPYEIHSVRLTLNGFLITFTKPVNKEAASTAANYRVQRWTYHYQPAHGSPKVGTTNVTVSSATVRNGAKAVHITLPDIVSGAVYHIALNNIAAADRSSLTTRNAYYTVNRRN